MSKGRPRPATRSATWVVRIAVLSAFVATLVLVGPRASQVLAARLRVAGRASPLVELDRVGFQGIPAWLSKPALLAVARDLQPWLAGAVPILDQQAALRLQRDLGSVPWVSRAQLQRVFPNRLRLHLELRRPVLEVCAADGAVLCLCDRDGVALSAVEFPGLPRLRWSAATGQRQLRVTPGERVVDEVVLAGVAVAVEWRDQVAPLVPGCPPLLEVDCSNLGERYIRHPHYPEIRVGLARSDGAMVVFAYDHAPDSDQVRVPGPDKAQVLRAILAKHPGLAGLVGGDLRFTVRWEDWLDPRPGPDPAGPWNPR